MEFQEFFILQGIVIQSVETFRSPKAVGLLDKLIIDKDSHHSKIGQSELGAF